jgi:hypothetical protein
MFLRKVGTAPTKAQCATFLSTGLLMVAALRTSTDEGYSLARRRNGKLNLWHSTVLHSVVHSSHFDSLKSSHHRNRP